MLIEIAVAATEAEFPQPPDCNKPSGKILGKKIKKTNSTGQPRPFLLF
jgi:hypothetical protein